MLGPFGAGVLAVLIPQIRGDLGTTTAAVTAGITASMVPFAALQLVSGTLGERWGLARTVRIAYLLYAAVSILTVVAPGIGLFLVGRGLQGAVNAFLSPLLLAALASGAPPGRGGRPGRAAAPDRLVARRGASAAAQRRSCGSRSSTPTHACRSCSPARSAS